MRYSDQLDVLTSLIQEGDYLLSELVQILSEVVEKVQRIDQNLFVTSCCSGYKLVFPAGGG